MRVIASAANPAYRGWLRLATQPRAVREEQRTLAEGVHLIEAALACDAHIDAVLVRGVTASTSAPVQELLVPLAARAPVYQLAAALYDRLALVEHGIGVAIVIATQGRAEAESEGDAVYLDGVQDPGNVGALLRVAAAAGVARVLASASCAVLWTPKVLRAAQGAHFRLELRENVAAAELRRAFNGVLVGTTLRAADSLWSVALPPAPVCWLFGSEGQGLSVAAQAVCDATVTIPLDAAVESLNVATAAAVCLFERRRRLLHAAP